MWMISSGPETHNLRELSCHGGLFYYVIYHSAFLPFELFIDYCHNLYTVLLQEVTTKGTAGLKPREDAYKQRACFIWEGTALFKSA